MAEVSIAYGQKVYMERRGDHIVIGLDNVTPAGGRDTLAEIGVLPGELDALMEAFEAEQQWSDPAPWFRWCDSEMPDAPAWERYASKSAGTEYKPRPRSVYDAQNGATRG